MVARNERPAPAATGSGSRNALLASECSADIMLNDSARQETICDGRRSLGRLLFFSDGHIDAVTESGERVGRFDRRQTAIVALLDHCRSVAA